MLIPIVVFLVLTTCVFAVGMLLMRGGEPETVATKVRLRPPRILAVLAAVLPITDRTRERQQAELLRAGFFRRHSWEQFAATRNVAVLLWILFAAVLLVMNQRFRLLGLGRLLAVGGIGFVIVFSLPSVVLSGLAAARKSRIYKSLPDALDMMTCLLYTSDAADE